MPPPATMPHVRVDTDGSPPTYSPRGTMPSPEPAPERPSMQSRAIKCTFWITFLSLLAHNITIILIMISGTSQAPGTNGKASHAEILLQGYSILDIPIKYSFLCPDPDVWMDCEAKWTIKMYLNAVWAYEDVLGDYTPIHLLWKGVEKPFDLMKALTIMDETLDLNGWYPNRNYTIPTEPTRQVRTSSLKTDTPFQLLIFNPILSLLLFVIWGWEWCVSDRWVRSKVVQRKWMFLPLLYILIACVAAIAYIRSSALKTMGPLMRDYRHIRGGKDDKRPEFGAKFSGLISGAIVTEVVALIAYSIHCLIESRLLKQKVCYDIGLQEQSDRQLATMMQQEENRRAATAAVRRSTAETDQVDPPDYAAVVTDLGSIRATERRELERIQARSGIQ